MQAMQLARELAKTEFWGSQPRKVLILAARFYAGVDSLAQLRSMAEPAVFGSNRWTGEDRFLRPALSREQVEMIVNLR